MINYQQNLINIIDRVAGGNKAKFAKMIQTTPQHLQSYFSRNTIPSAEILARISSLGVNINWFLTGEGEMMKPETEPLPGSIEVRPIPVLGRVPAGFPEDIHSEDIKDYIYVPNAPKNSFALVVQGQSMSGSNIQHGDFVIYIPVSEIKAGDIVIALNEFGAVMVKEYRIKDGSPWLVSTNPEFPSFPVNHAYKVVGKVIDVIRRIKI